MFLLYPRKMTMEVLFCIEVVMWALHNAQYYFVFQRSILLTITLGIGVRTRDGEKTIQVLCHLFQLEK